MTKWQKIEMIWEGFVKLPILIGIVILCHLTLASVGGNQSRLSEVQNGVHHLHKVDLQLRDDLENIKETVEKR